jgi:hypothetical protein
MLRCICIFLFFVFSAYAQEDAENILVNVQSGESFIESPAIEDVIEAVGTIAYAVAPIYIEPDKKSQLIRYAPPSEKVIIIASNEEWYNIRLYNGRIGFVEKRFVSTSRIFYDESVTKNYMDKRINVEISDLAERFNKVLQDSVYAEKYQIVPHLAVLSSAKQQNIITINLEYSAIDRSGSVIPSYQENMLGGEMRRFLGVIFLKMLPAQADAYRIVILHPVFNKQGQVLNTQKVYAEVVLKHGDVDIAKVRKGIDIYSLADCTLENDKLFGEYPH